MEQRWAHDDAPIHSDIDNSLGSFRSAMSDFSDSFQCTYSRSDFKEKIDKISDWVEADQKKTSKKTETKEHIEKVGKVITTTTNAIQKFKSGDTFEITSGTLDIISSVAVLFGGPYGAAAVALCSIVGAIFSANKPSQPSMVEELAEVVHKELVNFNKKLQDEKFNGLKDRISHQKNQLEKMSRKDKLDDPNLWNDYAQFLGELSERFESPLPFQYNKHLSKNADVADFVTAVVMYCQAHTCFLTLLSIAKGRFEDLGGRNDEKDRIDRNIKGQRQSAREKLAFLSDKKYLTFQGRLPSAGGKLTKIVSLSRNARGKSLVETVRGSLELPQMPSESNVESAATTVSKQRVKLNLERYPFPVTKNAPHLQVQFINDTKFPMKIVSGLVGKRINNLEFVLDLHPYDGCERKPSGSFSTGGYIIIYNDGKIRSSKEPAGDVRVIEFALSWPFNGSSKVNIQDKTASEFTKGLDTYEKMQTGDRKSVYWVQDGVNYIAVGDFNYRKSNCMPFREITVCVEYYTWCFAVTHFDPTRDVEKVPPRS